MRTATKVVWRHRGVLGAALATASALGVYLYALCPTVYAGDSGELSLASACLGIPHPPGYPVFVLLGRLAVATGLAEPAAMTNALCAALSALVVGCVGLLVYRAGGGVAAAVAGSGMVALGATFWGEATVTEVYPLACLGVAAILLVVEAYERTRRPRLLYLLAYLAGLALTLHQSLVLLVPALVWVAWHERRRFHVGAAVGSFLLGLTPLLVVVVRSAADPVLDWGDPESPSRLLALLLRRNYGGLQQNPLSLAMFLGQFQAFFDRLLHEIPLPALLLAPLGLRVLARRRPLVAGVTAGAFVGIVFGLNLLVNPALDSVHLYQVSFYYLPVYVVFAVWSALGLGWGAQWLVVFAGRGARAVGGVAAALMLAIPLWLFAVNFAHNDRRDFFDARVYGENILRSLPRDATLVTDGDNETFVLAYLTRAMGMRPDVTLAHRRGFLFDAPDYLAHSTRRDLAANSARWIRELVASGDDVYFATWVDVDLPGRRLEREGLVFHAVPANRRPDGERTRRLLGVYDRGVLARDPGSLEFIARKFAIGYLEAEWESRTPAAAGSILSSIGEMGRDFAEAQFFVGRELERKGQLERAVLAYEAAARLDPRSPFPRLGIERILERTQR